MRFFQRLLLLGIALITATNAAPTSSPSLSASPLFHSSDILTDVVEFPAQNNTNQDGGLEKRNRAQATLQWSPQGTLAFIVNMGVSYSADIGHAIGISPYREENVAIAVFQNFVDWSARLSAGIAPGSENYNAVYAPYKAFAEAVLRGGMFSKTIDENYVGWIIQLNPRDIVHLNACVALVSTWTEARGLHNIIPLSVLQRPNGFIHPANIGASPPRRRSLQDRSRTATCPKMKPQILNYVKGSVPVDLDLDKVMRFAGACK